MTEEYKRLRSKSDRCVVAISLFTFTYLYVAISGTISKPGKSYSATSCFDSGTNATLTDSGQPSG